MEALVGPVSATVVVRIVLNPFGCKIVPLNWLVPLPLETLTSVVEAVLEARGAMAHGEAGLPDPTVYA